MLIIENVFLKIQIYDKLVTMRLSYDFSVAKTFSTFADASLLVWLKYMFPENFNFLSGKLIIL